MQPSQTMDVTDSEINKYIESIPMYRNHDVYAFISAKGITKTFGTDAFFIEERRINIYNTLGRMCAECPTEIKLSLILNTTWELFYNFPFNKNR